MLTAADLEVNLLEFHQRSFQFARVAEARGETYALFARTETENERQLRPRLVRLVLAVPLAWVVLDEATDLLRLAAPGGKAPPPDSSPPTEVAAEPTEFDEVGRRWGRRPLGDGGYLYAPSDTIDELLQAPTRAGLGLG